jgi:nucleoside-diphosphate-sugar epimerase
MIALVTGGSGFIGRYLIDDLLRHNYNVRTISRKQMQNKKVETFKGDITKPETLNSAFKDVDVVFHNAAYAMDQGDKKKIYSINVEGTKNIANFCVQNNISRMIFTSSAGVYGFPNKEVEIDEDYEKNPLNYYQNSKLLAEKILLDYTDLKVSIVRPTLVFGKGGKAVEILLNRIKQRNMMFIGDGNTKIPLVHPADVAQCLSLANEKDKKGDIFNAVSLICTVKDLLNEITNQLNINPVKKHIPYMLAYLNAIFSETFSKKETALTRFRVKTFGTTRIVSNKKAIEKLGFNPKYDLSSMVKDMVS